MNDQEKLKKIDEILTEYTSKFPDFYWTYKKIKELDCDKTCHTCTYYYNDLCNMAMKPIRSPYYCIGWELS